MADNLCNGRDDVAEVVVAVADNLCRGNDDVVADNNLCGGHNDRDCSDDHGGVPILCGRGVHFQFRVRECTCL